MIRGEGGTVGTAVVFAEAPSFTTSEIVVLLLIVLLVVAAGVLLTFGGAVVLYRLGTQTLRRRWLIVPVIGFDLCLISAVIIPALSGDLADPLLLGPPALHLAGWIGGVSRRPGGRPRPD